MQIIHKPIVHKDARGTLTDIFEKTPVEACVLVTQKKGSSRGNHYHKKTIQYTYVLEGKLRYYVQAPGEKPEMAVVKTGDFVVSPAGHRHAFVAMKNSIMLAFAHGPRGGKSYESDTYRLDMPLEQTYRSSLKKKK